MFFYVIFGHRKDRVRGCQIGDSTDNRNELYVSQLDAMAGIPLDVAASCMLIHYSLNSNLRIFFIPRVRRFSWWFTTINWFTRDATG